VLTAECVQFAQVPSGLPKVTPKKDAVTPKKDAAPPEKDAASPKKKQISVALAAGHAVASTIPIAFYVFGFQWLWDSACRYITQLRADYMQHALNKSLTTRHNAAPAPKGKGKEKKG
jgi:hypothetical protein